MTDISAIDERYACSCRLGAAYTEQKTEFSVWSPLADEVHLELYSSGSTKRAERRVVMKKGADGVWRTSVSGDLDGMYYTYAVRFGDDVRSTADIYSRSACLNGKRGMIFSESSVSIDGWESDRPVKCKSPVDAVIYELHVRDFSMDENADFKARGKFLALCEEGVRNTHGDKAGLDYLRELGVTHIHLLPVMENGSVDEAKPTYNWGYDPYLYNVPEGSYSTDPCDGRVRVRELRTLVRTLHENGIGVILDVVYNHTYTVEDSPFSVLFPHYYYRHDGAEYSNGSGCGNELATERAMVRRFICDSVCALAQDYHIDGFRFDLMGLMDIETLDLCARELRRINSDIILYGEGWTGGASPLPEERRALKHHADKTAGVAMFSDDFRDGVKGSVFNERDCGYINGVYTKERRELIKSVLCGGVYHPEIYRSERQCWAKAPTSSVNYVEAHDNHTFRDKLALSMPKADEEERKRVNRLGAALVLLSQGIPFFQAGQELLRTKPDGNGGYIANSYKSPDSVNCIKWDDVTRYRGIVDYYRGLIAVRKAFPELRMTTAEQVRKIRFDDLSGGAFAAHIGRLILAVNPHRRAAVMALPEGEYEVLADGERAGTAALSSAKRKISVQRQSILLLKRKDT
ncbi:MAG: type I pullulanase [Ruminococcaceae bacterium]|nr:type I pullulanase [Oscillospiraceae bacterium]